MLEKFQTYKTAPFSSIVIRIAGVNPLIENGFPFPAFLAFVRFCLTRNSLRFLASSSADR